MLTMETLKYEGYLIQNLSVLAGQYHNPVVLGPAAIEHDRIQRKVGPFDFFSSNQLAVAVIDNSCGAITILAEI